MFRYIIVFLIGFFLGHAFSGNLGLLFQKTKELVLGISQPRVEQEYRVVSAPPRSTSTQTPTRAAAPVPVERNKRTSYQAVGPKPKPKPTVAGREQLYTVQVASFKTKQRASKYVEQLVGQQYDAFIAPSRSGNPTARYRVCIGETISPDQAKVLNTKLRTKFKDSFIYSF